MKDYSKELKSIEEFLEIACKSPCGVYYAEYCSEAEQCYEITVARNMPFEELQEMYARHNGNVEEVIKEIYQYGQRKAEGIPQRGL